MKKIKIVLLISIFLLFAIIAYAGVKGNIGKLQKPLSGQIIDTSKRIDVNNIDMPVSNTGDWAWNLTTGNSGFIFPKGTNKTAIYAGGIWIGGRVSPAEDIRVAISEYSDEYVPGIMIDSTFAPDEARFHVYKVNLGDNADNNPDYADWPDQDGAPVDSLGNPLILGDQTLWCVFNDADPAAHTNDAGSTAPLGIEVQQTVFAFNRKGALGNTIFIKYKLINKGLNYIDTCYVAVWSDPDMGGAADDLVGCDTLLSVGFVYNATNNDQLYDGTPPAVGYDFFQGPLVPGSPSDTGMLNGIPRPGFKNLGMTAFNKYINGTDPRTFTQAYQYLKGLDAVTGSGDPYRNPKTGEVTTYALSGDPVSGSGWLDTDPADRRLMLCSGPFVFAPGDTQEVVVGIVVGQGGDRLSSISAMKFYDVEAQQAFDANFVVPPPPPAPIVYYRSFEGGIDLSWDRTAEDFTWVSPSGTPRFLIFEGYNVYQGASPQGPWTKIAKWDLAPDTLTNDAHRVGALYLDQLDLNTGSVARQLDQGGTNSGLEHHLFISDDAIAGGKLIDGKEYYFAVTSYAFDTLHLEPYVVNEVTLGYVTFTTENNLDASIAITAKPLSQTVVQVDTAVHSAGKSTAIVDIEYIIQSAITGDDYKVNFNEDPDTSWNLLDVTTGDTLLKNQTNKSKDYEFPLLIDHGIQVRVWAPLTPGILDWTFTPEGKMWFTGVNWGGAFLGGGMDIGYNFFGSLITPQSTDFVDVEVRFSTTNKQKAYDYLRGGSPSYGNIGYFECPFTVWDVTSNPPRQINAAFVEQNGAPTYDSTWGPGESSSAREYLFILNSTYSDTPDPFYTTHDPLNNSDSFDVLYALWPVLVEGHTLRELADGQVFTILSALPATPEDEYTFKTYKVGQKDGNFVKRSLDNIWVVPNPFYTRAYNQGPFEHAVQFMNLPPEKWTIRVFNLAGDLVRTLHQEDPTSSVFFWDLLTEKGLPVASGIYIYYIEAVGLGSNFGKMAIFMEEERLPTF